jgi:uncharacterized protein (TIGR03790 family)
MQKLRRIGFLAMALMFACRALAGGSGLNVILVVNQSSSNSVQLGNYYAEKRMVPPQNFLRINWTNGNTSWALGDYQTNLLNPLMTMLSARGLTNQADFVVLSMDIPYRVQNPDPSITNSGVNSTTAALYYGFKSDFEIPYYSPLPSCNLPPGSSNQYVASESIFRATPPSGPGSNSFLTTMITSSTLDLAKAIVDHGVASDGQFPAQTVWLGTSSDRLRNIRRYHFDNTVFNVRLRARSSIQQTNLDNPAFPCCILGYENGIGAYSIGTNVFGSGAMADDLTSFAGYIFEGSGGQTTLLAFLGAGASCSYGTVIEPCAYFEKFPSSQNFFYQARGFSLAECYYQSVTNPYQGLVVGEPLAAPFAGPPNASWSVSVSNAPLIGTTNLTIMCTGTDAAHPVQQVDLFVDGLYLRTLTNIPPRQNNSLNVTISGHLMTYTVPASATVQSVAAGLTSVINSFSNTNVTKVGAFANGDRITLYDMDITKSGNQIPLSVSSSIGSATALTCFISASGTSLMDTPALGRRDFYITNTPLPGDYLQLTAVKTNGQNIVVSVTNTFGATNLAQLAKTFIDAVNTNLSLQLADGLQILNVDMHEDYPFNVYVYGTNDHSGTFTMRPRTAGWPQSQIQVTLSGSPTFTILPSGANFIDENVSDLQPRAHLYVSAGATNLPMAFALDTTMLANGYHELTAAAYEGSNVRVQKRVPWNVRITNSTLSATFTTLVGGSNTALATTLQFSVAANTTGISKIELFSTGGSQAVASNQNSAVFSIPGTNLDLGLHPFFAVVTAGTGAQYRTETKWIRLIGPEPPFSVTLGPPLPTLNWPATVGRSYDVLSTTNFTNPFQPLATISPTNGSGQFMDTNTAAKQRFYRVRTSN